MLSWLRNITLPSGNIPFFNDSSGNIAPSSLELFDYAEKLHIPYTKKPLSDSNYRLFKTENYTCVTDIGGIAPDYQPGHSHADSCNFVLEVDKKPVFVDSGCSTYEVGKTRMFERGTAAHNTVIIDGFNSSQVWASHRVGKRARAKVLEDTSDKIIIRLEDYKQNVYARTFTKYCSSIEIIDEVKNKKESRNIALFHLDSSIENITIQDNVITIGGIMMMFEGSCDIHLDDYEQAIAFNKRIKAKCIYVDFKRKLKTLIIIENKATI
jgi:hypothetical protein